MPDIKTESTKYTNSRNRADMASKDFESNFKNLKGTFAVENMTVSEESIKNLKRIDNGKMSYTDAIDELKLKYMQRV